MQTINSIRSSQTKSELSLVDSSVISHRTTMKSIVYSLRPEKAVRDSPQTP